MFFDLIDYYTEDKRAVDTSVQVALEILLQGTPFTVGRCDDLGIGTAYFIEENKLKSINDKIIPRWNCEIEIDNYTVTAKRRIGQDRNYRISRGKNLKGINYREDMSNVVTRLYAKGYDGLTFEDINDGKKYVDSPLIDKYAHVKAGDHHFEDIEDKEELLEAAQEHILTLDKPHIHYDIDLVELRDSDDYEHYRDLEVFGLGDTVQIYNDKLDIDINARILEYEYNPKRRQNSVVVLGNFTQRLEDTLGQFEDTRRKVDTSITDEGYVRTSRLQGVIDLLTNELVASASYQHAVPISKGALFENTNPQSPDYGALVAVPGKFAIANKKKSDGSWDWRTFGNGSGFVADYITSGVLSGVVIRTDDELNRLEMSEGSFKAYKDGVKRAELDFDSLDFYDLHGKKAGELIGIDLEQAAVERALNVRSNVAVEITAEESIRDRAHIDLMAIRDYSFISLAAFKDTSSSNIHICPNHIWMNVLDNSRLNIDSSDITIESPNVYIGKTIKALPTQSNVRIENGIKIPPSTTAFFGITEGRHALIHMDTNGMVFNNRAGTDVLDYDPSSAKWRFWRSVYVDKDFTVIGSKNSLQRTENYGERLINAYETAEYYFGDIGSGVINEDGECIVYIDDIFQECINTNIQYHVFTQTYNGKIDKIVRKINYFIVYGEPNTEFSWELKAKRKGYEHHRLEQPDHFNHDEFLNLDEDLTHNDNKELNIVFDDVLIDRDNNSSLEHELMFDLSEYLLEG